MRRLKKRLTKRSVAYRSLSFIAFLFSVSSFAIDDVVRDPAAAIETPISPLKILVEPGDRVVVKGFRGELRYIVSDAAKDVTVNVRQVTTAKKIPHQDEWQFSFRREQGTIVAVVEGPTSKQIWNEVLISGQIPEFNLVLTGPSLPLDINWNEGKITVANLNAEMNITAQKADVTIIKGAGALNLTDQEGTVLVRERKGDVKIDSYMAKVKIENIEGELALENFSGESQVQTINGNVNLTSFKGSTKVAEVKGRMEFKNGSSPLRIEKFEGELRGRSGQGPVYAEVRGEADVRVVTEEGAVNLKLPSSAAWVNVGTEEGSLVVPNFLKLTRLPSMQVRTGRLRGGSKGGSVFIRTSRGNIQLG